jgi:glucose-1-phosphate thymidylyltransferase
VKALILAAGYATRLYPLTQNTAKPLLPVNGKPLMDHLLDELGTLPSVDEVWLVTNHRFAQNFADWAQTMSGPRVRLLDDGSTSNDDRLGAVVDLSLALERFGIPDEGLCVCAADNLVRFPLAQAAREFLDRGASTIVVLEQTDPIKLRRTGVVVLDESNRVVQFQEKPEVPASTHISPAFYFLTAASLRRVAEYLALPDARRDAPGNFIAWLTRQEPVYGAPLSGDRVDIGCLADYQALQGNDEG